MTKEPQPTTHNTESGARVTCRERSETGSDAKRTEKKVGCSLIGEISWRFYIKLFGGLEKKCGETRWRFGGDMFGERLFGDFWRKLCRRFGRNVRRLWRKPFVDFGDLENFIRRNRGRRFGEIVQRFWRKPFGDFGDRYGVS